MDAYLTALETFPDSPSQLLAPRVSHLQLPPGYSVWWAFGLVPVLSTTEPLGKVLHTASLWVRSHPWRDSVEPSGGYQVSPKTVVGEPTLPGGSFEVSLWRAGSVCFPGASQNSNSSPVGNAAVILSYHMANDACKHRAAGKFILPITETPVHMYSL